MTLPRIIPAVGCTASLCPFGGRDTSDRGHDVCLTEQGGQLPGVIGADRLGDGTGAVEKHVSSLFAKLGLPESVSDHRRVLAVLAYLQRG